MKNNKSHENYRHLIWVLAVTDFKLRYQGSALGYVWAILQPLLMFTILNIVFSSLFARGGGIEHYSLQLIVSLMLFFFFSDGTGAGLRSLVSKSQLVTKIYVPRWTIIVASTINAALIFCMNLIVIIGFFAWHKFLPSTAAILMFIFFIITLYIVIVGFSLFAAPLYVRFRDVGMIWDVVLRAIMYIAPILYPLSMLPEEWHTYILLNPFAFVVHFNKEALINNHFADPVQYAMFLGIVIAIFVFGIVMYNAQSKRIAENI